MRHIRIVVTTLLLVAVTPALALADGMIIPFFGVNFGGDSHTLYITAATDAFAAPYPGELYEVSNP